MAHLGVIVCRRFTASHYRSPGRSWPAGEEHQDRGQQEGSQEQVEDADIAAREVEVLRGDRRADGARKAGERWREAGDGPEGPASVVLGQDDGNERALAASEGAEGDGKDVGGIGAVPVVRNQMLAADSSRVPTSSSRSDIRSASNPQSTFDTAPARA